MERRARTAVQITCGEEKIYGIALDPAQEVAAEPEVALEVADSWLDGGPVAKTFSGLAFGLVGGVGLRRTGEQPFGHPGVFASAVAAISDTLSGR